MMIEVVNLFKWLWARIICLFTGHVLYKERWKYTYYMNFNRKGGKRRCAGRIAHHSKHYRIYCARCGKVIKKK